MPPSDARICPSCRKVVEPRAGMAALLCPHCKKPLTAEGRREFEESWDAEPPAAGSAGPPPRTQLGIAQSALADLMTPEERARSAPKPPARPALPAPLLEQTCPACKKKLAPKAGMALLVCPFCKRPLTAEAAREFEQSWDAEPAAPGTATPPAKTRLGIARDELSDLLTPEEQERLEDEVTNVTASDAGAAIDVDMDVEDVDLGDLDDVSPPPAPLRALPLAPLSEAEDVPRPKVVAVDIRSGPPAPVAAPLPLPAAASPAPEATAQATPRAWGFTATVVVSYLAAALALALAIYRLAG